LAAKFAANFAVNFAANLKAYSGRIQIAFWLAGFAGLAVLGPSWRCPSADKSGLNGLFGLFGLFGFGAVHPSCPVDWVLLTEPQDSHVDSQAPQLGA